MTSKRLSSSPILRATLVWGGVVGAIVMVAAVVVGALVAGADGALSGLLGAAVGMIFPALSAVSILIANRWYGSPSFLTIYFSIVMGGWILKFALALVALIALNSLPWLVTLVFYFSLVAAAIAAIVVDVVVVLRTRIPAVSDTVLPGETESVS